MPKPPKPITDLDQAKRGLQDDHDPRDAAQQENDDPKGDRDHAPTASTLNRR
jgi:hypothetical protein